MTASADLYAGKTIELLAGQSATAAGTGNRAAGFSVASVMLITARIDADRNNDGELTLIVEHSDDGATWSTLHAFDAEAGDAELQAAVESPKDWLRPRWTVAGEAPNFKIGLRSTALSFGTGGPGEPGEPGADGTPVWRGNWSAGTYAAGEAVAHEGSSYVANAETTDEPPSGDWDVLALAGESGPGGSQPGALQTAEFLFTEPFSSFPIVGADSHLSTFTVDGDQTATFTPGACFAVVDSTGNDRFDFSVLTAVFAAGVTTITIDGGTVADDTADGDIRVYLNGTLSASLPIEAGTTIDNMELRPLLAADSGNYGFGCGSALMNFGDTAGGQDAYIGNAEVNGYNYITYDPANANVESHNSLKAVGVTYNGLYAPSYAAASQVECGARYAEEDELVMTIACLTVVSVTPPVAPPGGVLLVTVRYFAPVEVEDAAFSPE